MPELFQPQNEFTEIGKNTMLVRGVFVHMLASVFFVLDEQDVLYKGTS